MYTPGITTVSQPGYDMGRTVINKLLDNMHNSAFKNNDTIILNHSIIMRGSAK